MCSQYEKTAGNFSLEFLVFETYLWNDQNNKHCVMIVFKFLKRRKGGNKDPWKRVQVTQLLLMVFVYESIEW